jgi:hypothetical protein
VRARRDRGSGLLVVPLHALGHLVSGHVARDLGDGQVTARRHGIHESGDDCARLFLVGDSLQDPQQHDRDPLPPVQDVGRPLQDRAGGAQVGVDVGGRPRGLLVSRARAWASTIGSLSTYTTRDSGAARWATWCVLFAEGSPVPISRNYRIPASVTRKRTARARNARCARLVSNEASSAAGSRPVVT